MWKKLFEIKIFKKCSSFNYDQRYINNSGKTPLNTNTQNDQFAKVIDKGTEGKAWEGILLFITILDWYDNIGFSFFCTSVFTLVCLFVCFYCHDYVHKIQ